MIVGNLPLESIATPKLLLIHFYSMIQCNITDHQASLLCDSIRCVTGKKGYELNQVGGSSGYRSMHSDHDFLRVMNEISSALPRKCGACKIVPLKLGYRVYYKKNIVIEGKASIACVTYSVPTAGGSFHMKNTMMKNEIAYLKMTACMIMMCFNKHNSSMIAMGPLLQEQSHIEVCKKNFAMFGSYYLLIASYHSFNSYSAVFTNVGIHNATFWKRVESLANKCLFCDWNNVYPFCTKDSLGRSGSLVVRKK